MTIQSSTIAICAGALMLLAICGCSAPVPSQGSTIANPASEYCVKKGGTLEIVQGADGETGMCHLPDGTVVEEWALFRRENPQD